MKILLFLGVPILRHFTVYFPLFLTTKKESEIHVDCKPFDKIQDCVLGSIPVNGLNQILVFVQLMYQIKCSGMMIMFCFLAHLSTKCSW